MVAFAEVVEVVLACLDVVVVDVGGECCICNVLNFSKYVELFPSGIQGVVGTIGYVREDFVDLGEAVLEALDDFLYFSLVFEDRILFIEDNFVV
jgi:hypothetical protein